MGTISRITTWASGQTLTASDLNGEFNNIVTAWNNIDGGTSSWTSLKATTFNTSGTATFTGDVYTDSFQDYSATSTVVGWSSFTTKSIYYKKIGKLVWIIFTLDGTSNAITATFTLPYTVSSNVDIWQCLRARDNNVDLAPPGSLEIDKNTATVNMFKDFASGTWTSSARKIVNGQFVYQTT